MSKPADAKAVFQDVRDLPAAEQAAFLDAACGGDPALRARVEALLAADERAGAFLASPTGGGPDDSAPNEQPGTVIGHFKLQQQIGEGGFGTVWMAEQQQPVRRQVALKVVKRGMDTRSVVARFEQERQALALMDHPNIAKVFDGGETPAGRPYFAMELVRGVPITTFCDQQHLDTGERLQLFVQVCHAVQHAHQKGIIHRDLKPSNVLVTLHDSVPVPKVIDFGIAKAVHRPLTEKTLFTEFRQMVGTPEYMSPEQAELSGLDIDTRADIYSLGVLLYELLTGTLPFDAETLQQKGLMEMLRVIREDEPPKPSTRVSTPGASSTEVARSRRTDTRRLGKLLRGDLDWIVMKALEKDRARRYVSADALAADVQRHLRDEPVLASPPGRAYRLRKYVRRHRVGVTAGALVVAALVAGLSAAVWGLLVANEQRDRAVEAEGHAVEQAGIATAAKEAAEAEREKAAAAQVRAEQAQAEEARQRGLAEERRVEAESQSKIAAAQRDQAERIAAFMSETLQGAGPSVARGRDITMLREMMDAAAARIEKRELKDAPEAELKLRGTIGFTYCELAAYDRAAKMLEPALDLARSLHEGDHEATVEALTNLAHLREVRGDLPGAEPLRREAMEMSRRLCPGDDLNLANCLDNLAGLLWRRGDLAEAETLCQEALDMKQRLFPADHESVANSLNTLGLLLHGRGDYAGAVRLVREALEMQRRLFPGDHPSVAGGINNLASMLKARGKLAEAEPLCHEALEMEQRLYQGDHPDVANSLNTLGLLLQRRGDYAGAERLFRDALEMLQRVFPGDHPKVAAGLNNLAWMLTARGNLSEAEPLCRQALAMIKRIHQGDNPYVATGLGTLASVLKARGDLAGAEAHYREALEMWRRLFAGDHADVATGLSNLAFVLNARGDPAGAEPLYRQALAMWRRLFPGDHPDVATGLINLGAVLHARGDLTGAEPLCREALEMRKRLFVGDHPKVAMNLRNLAVLLKARGDLAGAEPLYRQALEMYRRCFPDPHKDVALCINSLADLLKDRGDLAGAEEHYREAAAMYDRTLGAGHEETGRARLGLGETLGGLGRFVEAEPELLAAEQVLSKAKGEFAGQHKKCLEALVEFYESWNQAEPDKGHDAQATQWKARLEQAK